MQLQIYNQFHYQVDIVHEIPENVFSAAMGPQEEQFVGLCQGHTCREKRQECIR